MPETDDRPKIGLSGSQVGAAILTTLTITAAASFLGRFGTLVGAVAASALSTVGAAIYAHWLRASGRHLKRLKTKRVTLSPLTLAAAGGVLLALTLGSVGAVEALSGRPVSALVRGGHQTGTTFGSISPPPPPSSQPAAVRHHHRHSASPSASSSPPASSSPAPSPTPTSPSPSVSTSAPSSSPSPAGTTTPPLPTAGPSSSPAISALPASSPAR